MHAPNKVSTGSLDDYLAAMARAALEPGLNWSVVESKWPGIVEAFEGFDIMKVSAYTPQDIERLMGDARVIRNRRKLEAIVHDAEEMLAVGGDVEGFRAYLRSFGSYEALVADMKKRFRFLGDSGAYHFLYVVGEQVPDHEDWMQQHRAAGPRGSRHNHHS
jgi:DNA-3-methyladenine glycosylase I